MKKTLLTLTALVLIVASADAKGVKKTHRKAKPTYYVKGDGTYSKRGHGAQTDATRPSPYKGDRVPENDGQKKNKERNLRYGQDAAPIPGK